jgi:hypothetical protein
MLLCRFWTVGNYSPQELTGQVTAAKTFDGKLMSAGLQIPIMCLNVDPESSLLKTTFTFTTFSIHDQSYLGEESAISMGQKAG